MTVPTQGARAPASALSLLAFFALTFAVSETCFISAAAWSRRLAPGSSFGLGLQALVLLGTFAPSLVALALTARSEGSEGVRTLLGRLFKWEVSWWCYLVALGYMAAFKLMLAVVLRLTNGAWPHFGDTPWYLLIAATLVSTVVGGQAGEEIGWRGYALPRLSARFGLGGASVVLGVIWACWHLPLFYLHGADKYGQSFPAYLLQMAALSVAIAWLYWRTNGSLLLTMLMHAAVNNTKDIVPTTTRIAANPLLPEASRMSWLGAGLLWIMATGFLVSMRGVSDPEGRHIPDESPWLTA